MIGVMMMMSVFLMASSCRYQGTSLDGCASSFAVDWAAFSGTFVAIAVCHTRQELRNDFDVSG